MISKEEYQVFKFFKDTYTKVNSATTVKILSTLDIVLTGCKNEEYFIFSGKILEENLLFKYLKDNKLNTEILMDQWKRLNLCLKKNINSIAFSKDFVEFSFKNDLGEDETISLKLSKELPSGIEKWVTVSSLLPKTKEKISDFIDDEVIEIFEENNKPSINHTDIKILEIPKNRVLAIQRGAEVSMRYSSTLPNGIRYVAISSSTDLLELEQIFATL